IICVNGFPISSFVCRQRSSLASHSACTLSVSRRFISAFAGLTLRHSCGRLSWCRDNESMRAKKSPQYLQNEIFSGCASMALQWRRKISQLLSPASGQNRHLSTRTVPRAQSSDVASRSPLCLGSRLLGM
ncbi:hypothetical protein BC827DRAFT_1201331, partial [Russula dissimulans]